MTDQTPDLTALTTVESTVARELPAGGEVTVEVRVTAPVAHLHAAYALNAAAVAADTALRATDGTHPAHRQPDQCGRTFVHLHHDTTAGWCAGLDGTEGDSAQPSLLDQEATIETNLPGSPFPIGVECPQCHQANTLLGYLLGYTDEYGAFHHQHTRYLCTYWPPRPENLPASAPGPSMCGWSGWSVR